MIMSSGSRARDQRQLAVDVGFRRSNVGAAAPLARGRLERATVSAAPRLAWRRAALPPPSAQHTTSSASSAQPSTSPTAQACMKPISSRSCCSREGEKRGRRATTCVLARCRTAGTAPPPCRRSPPPRRGVVEHLVQQEDRALDGRQRLEQHQERHRDRLALDSGSWPRSAAARAARARGTARAARAPILSDRGTAASPPSESTRAATRSLGVRRLQRRNASCTRPRPRRDRPSMR